MESGTECPNGRHALSQFNMPAMSPTMTEGGIAVWKKKEGENFSAGEVLLEIETDKATIDVEAQDDGVMAKIIGPDGTKNVKIGQPIAIVGEEGGEKEDKAASAPKAEPETPKSSPPQEFKEDSKPDLPIGNRIFASPIAKKIALGRGIPLSKVKGSGPNGRILREDVDKYKPAAEAATSTASQPAAAQLPDYVDTPISNMCSTIGSRLTQSKQEHPHYYVTVDINMDNVLKLREVFSKGLDEKEPKAKLSVNDFIVKAVGCALSDVPEANSAWLGDVIRTVSLPHTPRPGHSKF
ncbi:hypothetical protein MPER_12660 [Moniliophthora perniciosa FA553]|nr:hypothetical protein MPER_12660 [Moniliophthora perniciosa FA553]